MPVSVAMTAITHVPIQGTPWTLVDMFPLPLDRLGTPRFLCF